MNEYRQERSAALKSSEQLNDQRLAERSDRILDALATLIVRWGYAKTTVDDIAREAGVAKGTVYVHWASKRDMLTALFAREHQRSLTEIAARLAADPRGGTLSSIYRHTLALALNHPVTRAILVQDHETLGDWLRWPQNREYSRQRLEALRVLIDTLRASGLMRTDMSVHTQVYLLLSMTYGILVSDEVLEKSDTPSEAEIAEGFALVVQRAFEPESLATGSPSDEIPGRQAVADLLERSATIAATVSRQVRAQEDSKQDEPKEDVAQPILVNIGDVAQQQEEKR